ncbi:MAG: ANTAR domain-containing protein [Candidatus Methylomirabilis oxygeniifera]|uniref:ANTAR domain-containing protein n=1 Tax=Methylomirabilis oxygeniifera TaxID=671143 RepID=D5MG93_METO1|nr:MAG: ANTAR domain-containing protein [Candidatus Methylomirabilis oxyfera]CBE68774.1 protein of unknown function [Candidatus Methylomirabilis oxyfera]
MLGKQNDLPTTQRVLRTVACSLSGLTGEARSKHRGVFTPAEYAEAVVWLANQLTWDLRYRLASDHIRFTSTNCLAGEGVAEQESFCHLWCESLGRIAVDLFGYGQVIFKRRIAAGQQHCDFKIFVKHATETETCVEQHAAPLSATHLRSTPKGNTKHVSEETIPRLKTKVHLLEQRTKKLETVLGERKLIEKAKRILVERLKLSEPEAMQKLQQESQHRNIKLAEVAHIIVRAGEII